MKIKIVLNIILFSVLISGCYTIIERSERVNGSKIIHQNSFPNQSIIDLRLVGKWRKTFTVIDVGLGTQLLDFNDNGILHYKLYYNDFLVDDFRGEFRRSSDTLLIVFKRTEEIKKLIIRFQNEQLYLQNLESPYSDRHHSINNYPSRGGFEFVGQ